MSAFDDMDPIVEHMNKAIDALFPDSATREVAGAMTSSWSEGYDAGYQRGLNHGGRRMVAKISPDTPLHTASEYARKLGCDLIHDGSDFWLVRHV